LKTFEHYLQIDGESFATLIRNKGDDLNPFRLVATVYSTEKSNLAFDIVPINLNYDYESSTLEEEQETTETSTLSNGESSSSSPNKKRRSVGGKKHALLKRDLIQQTNEEEALLIEKNASMEDEVFDKKGKIIFHKSRKNPSRVNKKNPRRPTNLFIEMLVVTDESIFNDHKRFANTNDTAQVFMHMKIYYSHLLNGVNQRYANSFVNDADLRIHVRLTNFLFLTVN
jgi:hypothetical protein